jgi:hypothetical protein
VLLETDLELKSRQLSSIKSILKARDGANEREPEEPEEREREEPEEEEEEKRSGDELSAELSSGEEELDAMLDETF